MPTLRDLVEALDRLAPFSDAAAWDPVGLQLGDPDRSVTKVGVCHEVTAGVVKAAVAGRVDALVTYHPLIFRPTTSLVAGPGPTGRAFELVSAGTGLVVMHTNFDAARDGAADALASRVGLREWVPFGRLDGGDEAKVVVFVPPDSLDAVATAMVAAGAGRIGQYDGCSFRIDGTGTFRPHDGARPHIGRPGEFTAVPEVRLEMVAGAEKVGRVVAAMVAAHPYERPAYDVYAVSANRPLIGRIGRLDEPATAGAVAGRIVEGLRADTARLAPVPGRQVESVAVVPGSGGSFVAEAAAAGADLLVTGDVSHHEARRAVASGMGVLDVGHAPSERPGLERLAGWVSGIAGTATVFGDDAIDPWRAVR